MTESETIPTATYCYAHPTRETSLRCKRCERYMCVSCSVRTPTGYVCRECVKSHQKSFDTAEWYDYGTGFITAGLLSAVAAFLVTLIGGIGFFGWFLIAGGAPVAGTVTAAIMRSPPILTGEALTFVLLPSFVSMITLSLVPIASSGPSALAIM